MERDQLERLIAMLKELVDSGRALDCARCSQHNAEEFANRAAEKYGHFRG